MRAFSTWRAAAASLLGQLVARHKAGGARQMLFWPQRAAGWVVEGLAATTRKEAHLHRLSYNPREPARFELAFLAHVADRDESLEDMIWRVMTRFHSLQGGSARLSTQFAYTLFDGVFQRCPLKHLSGDVRAMSEMAANVKLLVACLVCADTPPSRMGESLRESLLSPANFRDRTGVKTARK